MPLCVLSNHRGFCLQAEASQQAANHKAQAEALSAELQSLYRQLADHKQATKQHPWAGTTTKGTARLHLPPNGTLNYTRKLHDERNYDGTPGSELMQVDQPATGLELR